MTLIFGGSAPSMQRGGVVEVGPAAEQAVDHRRNEPPLQLVRRPRLLQRQRGEEGQVEIAIGSGPPIERIDDVIGLAESQRQSHHQMRTDIADDVIGNRGGIGENLGHQGIHGRRSLSFSTFARRRNRIRGTYHRHCEFATKLAFANFALSEAIQKPHTKTGLLRRSRDDATRRPELLAMTAIQLRIVNPVTAPAGRGGALSRLSLQDPQRWRCHAPCPAPRSPIRPRSCWRTVR